MEKAKESEWKLKMLQVCDKITESSSDIVDAEERL